MSERFGLNLVFTVFAAAMIIIAATVSVNLGVYRLDEQTVAFLSQVLNVGELLMMPLLLGVLGAGTHLRCLKCVLKATPDRWFGIHGLLFMGNHKEWSLDIAICSLGSQKNSDRLKSE